MKDDDTPVAAGDLEIKEDLILRPPRTDAEDTEGMDVNEELTAALETGTEVNWETTPEPSDLKLDTMPEGAASGTTLDTTPEGAATEVKLLMISAGDGPDWKLETTPVGPATNVVLETTPVASGTLVKLEATASGFATLT